MIEHYKDEQRRLGYMQHVHGDNPMVQVRVCA